MHMREVVGGLLGLRGGLAAPWACTNTSDVGCECGLGKSEAGTQRAGLCIRERLWRAFWA